MCDIACSVGARIRVSVYVCVCVCLHACVCVCRKMYRNKMQDESEDGGKTLQDLQDSSFSVPIEPGVENHARCVMS